MTGNAPGEFVDITIQSCRNCKLAHQHDRYKETEGMNRCNGVAWECGQPVEMKFEHDYWYYTDIPRVCRAFKIKGS